MFPSNPTGIGVNSSFGLVPISGQSAASSSTDETRSLAFNWLGHLTGHGVNIFDEQQTGLKVVPDQMMDRSFVTLDRHTPNIPRRTPHSSVGSSGGTSSQPGTDAPHPIPDASLAMNSFHPYRLASDSLSATGHQSLSTSQFAAFDSMYKAYQSAYGSTAAGSVFGTQPFRFDSPLLADQRVMLQASLLQYPPLGIFPSPALYPGLPAASIRYPGEYYGQNLPSLPLSSKYPDVGGPSWLGLDRSMNLVDREQKDAKDGDRKTDLDLSKWSEKEGMTEHHRYRQDRDDAVPVRRDQKEDMRRCEDGRRDVSKHSVGEKELMKREQQKRTNSLKSPIRQEGQGHYSGQEGIVKRCNSGGLNDFSYNSGRVHGIGLPTYGMVSEGSGLPKVSSSPGGSSSQQRQVMARNDQTMEQTQDHVRTKDRHHHHHHHHHSSKSDEAKMKMAPLMLTVPKTTSTSSASTNGQQTKSLEKKFHRPFEQTQANSALEKADRYAGHIQREMPGKTSRISNSTFDRSESYLGRSSGISENKTGENFRFYHHHQPQQHQQQQQRMKGLETKSNQQHASSAKRQQGTSGVHRSDEVPLNLVITKTPNSSSIAASQTVMLPQIPSEMAVGLSNDDCDFQQLSRNPVPSFSLHKEVGFLAQAWNHTSSSGDDVNVLPGPGDGLSSVTMATTSMSKLDLEAKHRAKARKNDTYNSEEEEEDENLLDHANETARLLLITTGPPLKETSSESKLNYLASFGLVLVESGREIGFEQRCKRRRLFHERSVSPSIIDSSSMEPEPDDAGSYIRNELSHLDKYSFLNFLNLESVRSHIKKRKVIGPSDHNEMSDIFKGASDSLANDHVVNSVQNQCFSGRTINSQCSMSDSKHHDQTHWTKDPTGSSKTLGPGNLEYMSDQRSFAGLTGRQFAGDAIERWPNFDGDKRLSFDSKHTVDLVKSQQHDKAAAVHPQEDYKPMMGNISLLGSTGDSHVPSREGPSCPLDSSPFTVNSCNASTPSSASREVTNGQQTRITDHPCREPAFHWPGLEAVIESYHHYVEEQAMEKQLLNEQSQRLRHHNTELVVTGERLRSHMSDLLRNKQQLIEDRLQVQMVIDGLKNSLKQFL